MSGSKGDTSSTDLQPGRKAQKVLCAAIDDQRHARMLATSTQTDRARITSCAGEYAGAFLVPAYPIPASWLLPAEFVVVLRLRLGLPVAAEAVPCALCLGTATADTLGHHSCCCMEGGDRTHLHNALVDAVHVFSSYALLGSRREQNPFPLHPALRLDGMLTRGVARPTLTDQACIFPLRPSHEEHAASCPVVQPRTTKATNGPHTRLQLPKPT